MRKETGDVTKAALNPPTHTHTLALQPMQHLKIFILEIKEAYAIIMNITNLNPSFYK